VHLVSPADDSEDVKEWEGGKIECGNLSHLLACPRDRAINSKGLGHMGV